jgi:cystathionine beta-lyase
MNFDQSIDREEYPTLKWNKSLLTEHFGNDRALPFWVADMDFRAPDAVVDSLLKRVEHGIFGYDRRESY